MTGEPTADNAPESRPEPFPYEPRKIPKRAYLISAGGLVLGLFAGYSIGADSIPPAPLPLQGAPRPVQSPTDDAIPGAGMFFVGTGETADVRPGLYHSSGNVTPCIWRRSKDASGESSALIAHDTSLTDSYVRLKDGEFFDTTNCTTWYRVKHPVGPG